MNRWTTVGLLCLLSFPLAAEGAGGVEFTQVVGRDLWALPGRNALPSQTGQISGVGGFGYGVLGDGSVIGGFGMGVSSRNLDLAESPIGTPVQGFHAGYGGVIQGWQHRWGPLVGLVTTKIGLGGADWSVEGGGTLGDHTAGFSVLGMAEAQLGVLVFPWFQLGFKAGAAGTITLVPGEPFLVAAAPVLGMRLSWGSF